MPRNLILSYRSTLTLALRYNKSLLVFMSVLVHPYKLVITTFDHNHEIASEKIESDLLLS